MQGTEIFNVLISMLSVITLSVLGREIMLSSA